MQDVKQPLGHTWNVTQKNNNEVNVLNPVQSPLRSEFNPEKKTMHEKCLVVSKNVNWMVSKIIPENHARLFMADIFWVAPESISCSLVIVAPWPVFQGWLDTIRTAVPASVINGFRNHVDLRGSMVWVIGGSPLIYFCFWEKNNFDHLGKTPDRFRNQPRAKKKRSFLLWQRHKLTSRQRQKLPFFLSCLRQP